MNRPEPVNSFLTRWRPGLNVDLGAPWVVSQLVPRVLDWVWRLLILKDLLALDGEF
jgi:hypothetical protein